MNYRPRTIEKAYHRLFQYFKKIGRKDEMISITFRAYGIIAAREMQRQLKRLEAISNLKYHHYEKENNNETLWD